MARDLKSKRQYWELPPAVLEDISKSMPSNFNIEQINEFFSNYYHDHVSDKDKYNLKQQLQLISFFDAQGDVFHIFAGDFLMDIENKIISQDKEYEQYLSLNQFLEENKNILTKHKSTYYTHLKLRKSLNLDQIEEIGVTKALEIVKGVKDKKKQNELVQDAIDNELSIDEIKGKIIDAEFEIEEEKVKTQKQKDKDKKSKLNMAKRKIPISSYTYKTKKGVKKNEVTFVLPDGFYAEHFLNIFEEEHKNKIQEKLLDIPLPDDDD